MYKTVIVEDEYHLREALAILLGIIAPKQVEIVGYAENAAEATALIERLRPDLIFMDIQLQKGTAFDVLNALSYKNFHLIFTTAYDEHALRAFKYNALDYLLKPIDSLELQEAIKRIPNRLTTALLDVQLQQLAMPPQKKVERLVLPTQEAMHVVQLDQIIRCETSGSYTSFFLRQAKPIIVSKPLKHYEELLAPPQFYRVHQSHLINTNYVISYSRDGSIVMADKATVPISRSKKESFFKLMREGKLDE